MLVTHADVFGKFKALHDRYVADPEKYQDEFNSEGAKILEIIRIWEKKLCGKTESGQYAKFSSGLSDKFWSLVRNDFPKIDFVGAKVKFSS